MTFRDRSHRVNCFFEKTFNLDHWFLVIEEKRNSFSYDIPANDDLWIDIRQLKELLFQITHSNSKQRTSTKDLFDTPVIDEERVVANNSERNDRIESFSD